MSRYIYLGCNRNSLHWEQSLFADILRIFERLLQSLRLPQLQSSMLPESWLYVWEESKTKTFTRREGRLFLCVTNAPRCISVHRSEKEKNPPTSFLVHLVAEPSLAAPDNIIIGTLRAVGGG